MIGQKARFVSRAFSFLLAHQILIPQPLIHQPPRHALHLNSSIKRALVVTTSKFVDISTKVHIREEKVQPRIPINSADWSAFLQEPRWQDIVTQCNAAALRVLEQEKQEDPEQRCTFVFFREEEWAADA